MRPNPCVVNDDDDDDGDGDDDDDDDEVNFSGDIKL